MALIPLASIDASSRLRPIDPDHALFIASGLAQEGLKSPIEVRPANKRGKHPLVTGGHRLEAARLLGWTEIEAVVLDISPDEARLREINENVYRVELSELDRAVFLAEKKRLHEKMHPETRHGGDRKSDQVAIFGDLAARFTEEACERLGFSERTLQRVVARAKIAPEVRAKIAGTRLARTGAELDALVRLTPEQQIAAVLLMFSGEEDAPASVGAAVRAMSGERPAVASEAEQQLDALMKAWRRASAATRTRFTDYLIEQGEFDPAAPAQKDAA